MPASGSVGLVPTPDDYRGWFYRVVAPHSAIAVMQSTAAVTDRWFTNAIRGDVNFLLRSPPATPSLDMVILHGALGGCSSVKEALRAAHRLLRQDGIVWSRTWRRTSRRALSWSDTSSTVRGRQP